MKTNKRHLALACCSGLLISGAAGASTLSVAGPAASCASLTAVVFDKTRIQSSRYVAEGAVVDACIAMPGTPLRPLYKVMGDARDARSFECRR